MGSRVLGCSPMVIQSEMIGSLPAARTAIRYGHEGFQGQLIAIGDEPLQGLVVVQPRERPLMKEAVYPAQVSRLP